MLALLLAALFWTPAASAADRLAPAPVPTAAPLLAPLSPLAVRGWDVWKIEPHLSPAERAAAVASASTSMGAGQRLLLWEKSKGWIAGQQSPDPERIFERFAESVDGTLRRALPEETLVRQTIQLRAAKGEPAAGRNIHPDGGWITVTHAIKGPGTLLYPFEGGRPSELDAGNGIALITGVDRQFKLGVPATIHSAPREDEQEDRLVFIARYRLAGFDPTGTDLLRLQQETSGRVDLVGRYLRSLGRRVYDLSDEIARLGRPLIRGTPQK